MLQSHRKVSAHHFNCRSENMSNFQRHIAVTQLWSCSFHPWELPSMILIASVKTMTFYKCLSGKAVLKNHFQLLEYEFASHLYRGATTEKNKQTKTKVGKKKWKHESVRSGYVVLFTSLLVQHHHGVDTCLFTLKTGESLSVRINQKFTHRFLSYEEFKWRGLHTFSCFLGY